MRLAHDDLYRALALFRRFVDKKSPMPILACVRIKSEGGRATLTGCDGPHRLSTVLAAEGSGDLAFSLEQLYQALTPPKGGAKVRSKLPPVDLAEGSVSRAGGTVALESFPDDHSLFDPPEPPGEPRLIWAGAAQDLVGQATWALKAASTDEGRPYLTGLILGEHGLVGTDGHRLHLAGVARPEHPTYIPDVAAKLLPNLLKLGQDCLITCSGEEFRKDYDLGPAMWIGIGDFGEGGGGWTGAPGTWSIDTSGAALPVPYERILPKDCNTWVPLEAAALVSLLSQGIQALGAPRDESVDTVLTFNEDTVQADMSFDSRTFSAGLPHGAADLRIKRIGVNARYLLDAVQGMHTVILGFNGPIDAILVVGQSEDGPRTALVMPMRM